MTRNLLLYIKDSDCSGSQETEFRSQNGNTGDEV